MGTGWDGMEGLDKRNTTLRSMEKTQKKKESNSVKRKRYSHVV